MEFRGEWDMRKVKWDLNMQECFLHAARLIQISSESLIHRPLGQQKDCSDFTGFAVHNINAQITFRVFWNLSQFNLENVTPQ